MAHRRSMLTIFSPEWFSIALGTLALSVVLNRFANFFSYQPLIYLGIVFLALGVLLLMALSILVTSRAVRFRRLIWEDWNDLNKISFMAVLPLSLLIFNVSLLGYFPRIGNQIYLISTYNYFIDFLAILFISLFLGYKLYTKELAIGEITYALLVPPVALSTTTLLGVTLLPFLSKSLAQLIYFQIILGLGIAFFLFLFLGSLALASHAKDIKTLESSPITIIPMGVASIIVINILLLSKLSGIFLIPIGLAIITSMILWGFELWNFGVALLVSVSKIPQMRPSISVWAYTFPLAIFSISSLQLAPILSGANYVYPSYLLYGISLAAAAGLFAAWVYSSVFTIAFLLRISRQLKVIERGA